MTSAAGDSCRPLRLTDGLILMRVPSGGAAAAVVPHSSPVIGKTCAHLVVLTAIFNTWLMAPAWISSSLTPYMGAGTPRWPRFRESVPATPENVRSRPFDA